MLCVYIGIHIIYRSKLPLCDCLLGNAKLSVALKCLSLLPNSVVLSKGLPSAPLSRYMVASLSLSVVV